MKINNNSDQKRDFREKLSRKKIKDLKIK